jgi:hypothetical protein
MRVVTALVLINVLPFRHSRGSRFQRSLRSDMGRALERIRDAYHDPDGLTTVRMGLVEMRP